MPKNIDDIVVPERRRSIRDIPIPEGRRRNDEAPSTFAPRSVESFPIPPSTRPPITLHHDLDIPREEKKSPKFKKSIWLGAGALILIIIFAVLSIFNGATLAYVPKSKAVSFNNEVFTAQKTGEGSLLYSVIKLSGDKGVEVTASGSENVERKASGVIVVYNNASADPQRLVEKTRFQTAEGLVYRTPTAIVIPGKKMVNGASQPGSLEVTVYADEAGEKYNIPLSDFTLPGLAGSDKFNTIYARSKTEMSGGFSGVEKVVKAEDKARVATDLQAALKTELTSEVNAQVPKDFVMLPALSFVTYEDLPQTNATNPDSAMVNMRGNLYGVMFKRTDLSNYLVRDKMTLASGESIDIPELETMNFAFVDVSAADLPTLEGIKFSLKGDGHAVWRTDEVALKTDLVGKNKQDIPAILNNYPTIESATATIRPFWKSSFPSDSSRITMKKLPIN